MPERNFIALFRGVARRGGGLGGQSPRPSPEFGSSVDPMYSNLVGRLCPSHYCQPPRFKKLPTPLLLFYSFLKCSNCKSCIEIKASNRIGTCISSKLKREKRNVIFIKFWSLYVLIKFSWRYFTYSKFKKSFDISSYFNGLLRIYDLYLWKSILEKSKPFEVGAERDPTHLDSSSLLRKSLLNFERMLQHRNRV